MTKLFLTLPALALVVILSGSAVADNGISSSTLREMGLAGLQVMSDADAMAIRGLGYDGGNHMPKPKGNDKPWVLAFGVSYAKIETCEDCENGSNHYGSGGSLGTGEAGTLDGFIAEGKYNAAGEHGSEAGIVKSETKTVIVPGQAGPLTETTTRTLRVFAGGFAKASAL